MFAPDPPRELVRIDATVLRFDGTVRTWEFVPPAQPGILHRLKRQRLRKWANDNMRVDDKRLLWAPAARFAAGQFDDPSNTPLFVRLNRHWLEVPDPWGKLECKTGWQHWTFYGACTTWFFAAPADSSMRASQAASR
jgi:hypothetical protein